MSGGSIYQGGIKRACDVALSTAGIVVLSPVLAALAVAIRLDSPGPILFRQERMGRHSTRFDIYKFRSMRVDTPKDVPTHQLQDPDRYITRTGHFLRRTSLDELPQLLNIWKGDMSVVGPRPCLPNQTDLIAEREHYGANDLTPGLTGWAQVNGRDELEIPVKARLDGEYAAKVSPAMDARCFLITVGSVIDHDGVVEGGTGEMSRGATAHGTDAPTTKASRPAFDEAHADKLRHEEGTGAVITALGIVALVGLTSLVAHRFHHNR
jgi:lipopolysaccharide/colanic/teichoic acid biosynthesis glycosyltransferase